jgi:hypothetical protein
MEVNGNEKRRDGLMFLWTIINRTTNQTNATITVIIHQLNHLETEMNDSGSDVSVFNTKVRKLLNSFYANKQQVFDEEVLLTNLADAYFACKDNDFVDYVKRKWQDHIDETRTLTSSALMELALKQYQTMVEQKKWGIETSNKSKQIMTLASQVGNLRQWKTETENKDKESGKTSGTNSGTKQDVKGNDKRYMNAKEWRKEQYNKAPDWMKKKPDDVNKTMKKNNKVYHWCSHHKLWQQHKASECRLNPTNRADKSSNDNHKQSNNDDKSTSKDDKNNNQVQYKATSMIAEHDSNNLDSDI